MGVAQTIRAAGLEGFYVRRAAPSERPTPTADQWTHYDTAAETVGVVARATDGFCEASLLLEGIHCPACIWLTETYLKRQVGVVDLTVNFATRRARVRWDPRKAKLSDLLRAVAAIGYRAYPYDSRRREALAQREARALLTRMAIALLAMMQVMMFAVPAYITTDGIAPEQQALLDWASLVLTLPVVLYCAAPFFKGAVRDLRFLRLGMDVPVALGVGGAFAASAWATGAGGGAVYYDSVAMFVALLLIARYVELRARQKAGDAIEAIARDLPETAERLPHYPMKATAETVAAARLVADDVVRVPSGAVFPADGDVIEGRSSVEEAVLTGESRPRSKKPGDAVLAGSINRESPLTVRVTAAGEATRLAAVIRLVERVANERPRAARLADRVAAWFVALLLLVAAVAALAWLQIDPSRALAVTFAVLVVSCPCALSLATPAALAAAAGTLGRQQILAVRGDALETLARVTHVVFDKTGTLTTGYVTLVRALPLGALSRSDCLGFAAALEQASEHPVARALLAAATPAVVARDVVAVPGCGVEGVIGGTRYRLGRPDWAGALHGRPMPAEAWEIAPDATPVALADAHGWLATFTLSDTLKPGVPALIARLKRLGVQIFLLSGDRGETARHVAQAAGIAQARGDATPDDKRAYIAALQREGSVVAMVGDGVNDAPSLARANVSISLGSAAALTQWTADIVVLGEDVERIADAIAEARRTFRVIVQNLVWAFAYNVVAIPLAATGHLTPLAAALGMSVSSLLVVGNALRLSRTGRISERQGSARAGGAPVAAKG
jgi:Cu2+-exporting ATPase